MPKIPINGPLSLSQNIPNVDGRFGPYTSVAEANEYLGPAVNPTDEYDDVISAGMLFGVYEDDGSVTICMWTKDHATVNDFKRISHAQVVQFNGIVTGIVSINQSSGATAKTASDIKYLEQNKKFGYLQGSGYIVNWVNRYIWADSDQNPYQDVLYLNIATNALYYYTGTALVALTAGSQGSLVTSVNGQTGAVTITIPTKLSDLTNDVGFITNAGVTSFNGQTGAVTYTPPVTSVNNKTGAVVLDKTDVGLGNVDNTPDANKQVYSAIHDGSGNPIDETYETKTHATAQHSLLQSNIDSLANVAANLTGLDSTNFGGFSLAVDAATAVSNIPTVFTQNGCTVGQPYWFLAGPDMSALVAYRYIGSGTPAAISATEYDFTDFSRLSEQVKDFKGTITTLSAIDDLHNVADVGVYHVKVSQFSGLLIVEKFNDGLNTTITQQLIASGTPVNQGGSYTIERGQTLARRAYSSGAWTSWTDPIAELQANVAALGPKIDQIEGTLNGSTPESITWYGQGYGINVSNGSIGSGSGTVDRNCTHIADLSEVSGITFSSASARYYVAFYDSSSTFISAKGFKTSKTYAFADAPTTAAKFSIMIDTTVCSVTDIEFTYVTGKGLVDEVNDLKNSVESLEADSLKDSDIVNDLETGGATKILSAEQGLMLNRDALLSDLRVAVASRFLRFESGKINSNGSDGNSTALIHTKDAIPTPNEIYLPEGWTIGNIFYYSDWTDRRDFTYVSNTVVNSRYCKPDTTKAYCRFTIAKTGQATLSVGDMLEALGLPMPSEDLTGHLEWEGEGSGLYVGDGSSVASADRNSTLFFPITNAVKLSVTCSGTPKYYVCYYGSKCNFISAEGWKNTKTYTFDDKPVGATYARLDIDTTTCQPSNFQLDISGDGIVGKIGSIDSRVAALEGGSGTAKEIVVDANGGGDYTTIEAALANANDSASNHVVIKVMPGTYYPAPEDGTTVPYEKADRNLTIYGVDKNACILRGDVGYYRYQDQVDYSILRLNGNITIKGFTILSLSGDYDATKAEMGWTSDTNKRAYCIHCDAHRVAGDIITIEDCNLINDHFVCIGFGLHPNCILRIKDCYCEMTVGTESGGEQYGTIYGHMASGAVGDGQDLEIIRCQIVNKSAARVMYLTGAGSTNTSGLKLIQNVCAGYGGTTFSKASNYVLDPLSYGNNVSSMNYSS